jgi:hypothetical protein
LNPSKYFAIREKERRQATRLRIMFNKVMWKMVSDDGGQNKISKQANDYERAEGDLLKERSNKREREKQILVSSCRIPLLRYPKKGD